LALDTFMRSWKTHSINKLIPRNMLISHMKISRISARILPLNRERRCSLLQLLKEPLWKHHCWNPKFNMNTLINCISTVKMEKWRCFCVQMKLNNKKSKRRSNHSLKWKFRKLNWNLNLKMLWNQLTRTVIPITRFQMKEKKKILIWIIMLHRLSPNQTARSRIL